MLHSLQAVPEDQGQGRGRGAVRGRGRPAHFGGCWSSAHASGQESRSQGGGDTSKPHGTLGLRPPTARKVRFGAVPPDPGRESGFGEGERGERVK